MFLSLLLTGCCHFRCLHLSLLCRACPSSSLLRVAVSNNHNVFLFLMSSRLVLEWWRLIPHHSTSPYSPSSQRTIHVRTCLRNSRLRHRCRRWSHPHRILCSTGLSETYPQNFLGRCVDLVVIILHCFAAVPFRGFPFLRLSISISV